MTTKQTRAIILVVALLVMGIIFFGWLQSAFFGITQFLEALVQSHPVLGPFAFIAFAACSVLLGPFSSSPLIPSAVFIWGPFQTTVFLLGGWLIGNTLAYILGYTLGRPLLEHIVEKETFAKWTRIIQKEASFGLAFLFRFAMPAETGYLFGMIRYEIKHYLLLTFLAELPFALVAIYVGQAFIQANWFVFFILALVYAVMMTFASALLRRRISHD